MKFEMNYNGYMLLEMMFYHLLFLQFPDEDISFKGLLNLDLSKNKLTSEFIK